MHKGNLLPRLTWPWLAMVLLATLNACTPSKGIVLFPDRDGPPPGAIDISAIPDPVPRSEPRSRYGNPPFYIHDGVRYDVLPTSKGYVERGIASWYGTKFHGRRTSSGEPYDMYAMTAAHKTLPLPTYAQVTNLHNGRSVIVRINDRGPFKDNRIIDLSYAAAAKLGILAAGTAPVEVRAIDPEDHRYRTAAATVPPPHISLYLQVGAFTNLQNAERLRLRLQNADLAGAQVTEGVSNNMRVYRVRIGPLASVSDADRIVAKLIELGINDSRIVID